MINMVRGTTRTFAVYLTNEDKEPYVLPDGAKVVFGVKKNPENEEYLIFKTVTSVTNGVCEVNFAPADTINLPFGRYFYDVSVESGADFYNAIEADEFWIRKNITKWGDAQ